MGRALHNKLAYTIHEDKSSSPPPCQSTWFVNIPQGMTNSMQVTKDQICCLFTYKSHLFKKNIFLSKCKKSFPSSDSNRGPSACEANAIPFCH